MNDAVNEMADAVQAELTQLFMKYDTKLLATAMMIRSAVALRAVHSAGIWKVSDVKDVVEGALEDIYTPLPQKDIPPVASTAPTVLQ